MQPQTQVAFAVACAFDFFKGNPGSAEWKRVHNRKLMSFLQSLDVNYMKVWHSLSHQIDLEGASPKTIFFFSILCGKAEKKRKYNFWLQKDVKIENQYDFWNLWTLIISKFWQSLSHQIHFEGISVKSIFFLSVLYRKAEKQKNTIFCYKKGSKPKTNIILKIFGR